MSSQKPILLIEKIKEFPHRSGTAVIYFIDGVEHSLTWPKYQDQIAQVIRGLKNYGVKEGSKIAIQAATSLQWILLDIATQYLNAVTVPIYSGSTKSEVEFILNDSQAEILFSDTYVTFQNCPRLKVILDLKNDQSWEEFTNMQHEFSFQEPTNFKPSQLATIVYTSGTTGRPKGVCLTHEQIQSEVQEAFEWAISPNDTTLCFLPLAHILGRVEAWAHIYWGSTIGIAENIDSIRSHLQVVKPTLLMSVPRIFEKFYDTILSQMESFGPKRTLFHWALEVGRQTLVYRSAKRKVPLTLASKFEIADQLVFSKIRNLFGGRLRFAISGGAPLSTEVSEFFLMCGVLILEGYGLTETTAAITVNRDKDFKFGTVGKPIGDVQIKIAEDGEILIKSKKVMTEYFNRPEETQIVFEESWLKTGDIGEVLPSGHLRITDRKKDLIKISGGKYVAPQKLEALLKNDPLVSEVLIYGDQKKYIVALIQIKNLGPDLAPEKVLNERMRAHVSQVNQLLAGFESIKKFALTFDDWTVEGGELTPSLKLKRKMLTERYKNILDDLY